MTGKSKNKKKTTKEEPTVEEPIVEEECVSSEAEETVDPVAEAEAKANEYLDMARRLQADFDNYRKRVEREKEEFRDFATANLISELLSIVDDFDRALEHVDKDDNLAIGFMGIRKNLFKILESKGLEEIDATGKFNPNLHEALCMVDGENDGDIAEVFQKGYCIGNRVLRYAKVKVTKKKQE